MSSGVETGEEHIGYGATLTEPEKELLREELKKVRIVYFLWSFVFRAKTTTKLCNVLIIIDTICLFQTEEEINTLRQVLASRQKHAALLKHKLGITPLAEFNKELQQTFNTVKESQAYQKTNEVVANTAEQVQNKLSDMRNSSYFKSFESRLGSAFSNVS